MWQGYSVSRSKQRSFPFVQPLTVDVIASAGITLWNELFAVSEFQAGAHVTCVQLTFTGLEATGAGHARIERFLVESSSRQPRLKRNQDDLSESDSEEDSGAYSFICKRCGKRISLSTRPQQQGGVYDDFTVDPEEQLTRLRVEHDDHHLAEDLSKAQRAGLSPIRANDLSKVRTPPSKARQYQKTKSIASFFGGQGKSR